VSSAVPGAQVRGGLDGLVAAAGIIGPFLFAQVVTHFSYQVAWLAAAGSSLAAAITMLAADRMLDTTEPDM